MKIQLGPALVIVFIIAVISSIATFSLVVHFLPQNAYDPTIVDSKIVMSEPVQRALDELYENPEVEIAVCLAGETVDNNFHINDYQVAETINANRTSVTYKRCPTYVGGYRVMGTVHNHPEHCYLSPTDLETYYYSTFTQGHVIIALYCENHDVYKYHILNELSYEVQ